MTAIDKFVGSELRSRYVNPTWIEGMQREGYAGAGEMRAFVEYLWGWDATVTDVVDDAMWQESFAVYVEDKHELGMKAFFEAKSPFAYQDMTGRMMETIRKGYWAADRETLDRLLTEYVESVNTHGVGCAEHTCGNPRLLEYVLDQARIAEIPAVDLEAFEQALGAGPGDRYRNGGPGCRSIRAPKRGRVDHVREPPGPPHGRVGAGARDLPRGAGVRQPWG